MPMARHQPAEVSARATVSITRTRVTGSAASPPMAVGAMRRARWDSTMASMTGRASRWSASLTSA